MQTLGCPDYADRHAIAGKLKYNGLNVRVAEDNTLWVWTKYPDDGSVGYDWHLIDETLIPRYQASPPVVTPPDPVPEPIPPPQNEQNRWKNPFNDKSYVHVPMGTGAKWGVSSGTNVNTPAIPNSNGTFGRVGLIKLSSEKLFLKYCDEVKSDWNSYQVKWNNEGSADNKLPCTIKLPDYIRQIFTTPGKDSNYMTYDPASDVLTMFYGMYWDAAKGWFTARYRKTWGFNGVDHSMSGHGNGDSGSGAGRLHHVAGSYNWIEARDALPILHALQCTATYAHSTNYNKATHVLGDCMTPPAAGKDGSSGGNGGNNPYGQRYAIFGDKIAGAMALQLGPRQSRLRDCFIDYGLIVIDGTGETTGDSKAIMQIRCRNSDTYPTGKWQGAWLDSVRDDIHAGLKLLLPFLRCVMNGEIVNGVIGGGQPVRPSAVNSAYNATVQTSEFAS